MNEKHKVEPHPVTFTDATNPKKSTFTELFDAPLKMAERIQELESQLEAANATIAKLTDEVGRLKGIINRARGHNKLDEIEGKDF